MLRREFLSTSSLFVSASAMGWAQPQGMKNIQDYGARGDGRTLNTTAIQQAIDDAFKAGGGTIYVPQGNFLTGRIDLKNRVGLYLGEGSTLLGSSSISDYHGSSGSVDRGGRHLIYARGAEEVTLAGPGRIDGQGPAFWEPSGIQPRPPEQAWADVASHSLVEKKTGRPGPMIRFVECKRVRVTGVRLENSPGWTLHLLNCDGVKIDGMAIRNPVNGPNTDGIDLTGCQDVQVTNCTIETGDDAICVKSENPLGPEPRVVKNITVTNCRLTTCCNGFKLGTSSEGGFENIVFSDSTVTNAPVSFGERVVSGVALEVVDGGWIDGVHVSRIRMERTRAPIFLRLGNRKRPHNYSQHGLRNVRIEDIQATEALLPSSILGIAGDDVRDVTLSNIRIENALSSRPEWVGRAVPEKDNGYPEAIMFGMLPATGLYVRHARDLRLEHLDFTAKGKDERPAILLNQVNGAQITALSSTAVKGGMPVVKLEDSRDISISNSTAPAGTATFVGVSGSASGNIVLAGNDLHGARQPFATARDVTSGAVMVKAL